MEHPGKLKMFQRVITTHDANGKYVFSTDLEETTTTTRVPADGSYAFTLAYSTAKEPSDLNADKDLQIYKQDLKEPPSVVRSEGTVVWNVDTGPGKTSVMHRTVSIDFGVVIYGQLELILDSGETRLLKAGDVAVQRGTMHAWRNPSETEWARMVFFVQPIVPISLDGKELKEDLAGADPGQTAK